MNNRLIATLAALAIAAPLMACGDDQEAPEQTEGVKQADEQQQKEDDKLAEDQKQSDEELRQASMCTGSVGSLGTNPTCPGGGGY